MHHQRTESQDLVGLCNFHDRDSDSSKFESAQYRRRARNQVNIIVTSGLSRDEEVARKEGLGISENAQELSIAYL